MISLVITLVITFVFFAMARLSSRASLSGLGAQEEEGEVEEEEEEDEDEDEDAQQTYAWYINDEEGRMQLSHPLVEVREKEDEELECLR